MELATAIIRHPKLWNALSDDFSPPREQFETVDHPAIWYVLARDGGKLLGMFVFTQHSPVCWEVHTCLLPSSWGERAKAAARGAAGWIWANTPCRRIITNVPAYNRLALKFAEAAGMKRFGVNEKSYMKRGKLWDQIMLGLSRPEGN